MSSASQSGLRRVSTLSKNLREFRSLADISKSLQRKIARISFSLADFHREFLGREFQYPKSFGGDLARMRQDWFDTCGEFAVENECLL